MDPNVAGATQEEAKWPRPVDFRENDPKKGYVYILITIPEIRSPSKNVPKNVVLDNPSEVFKEKEINFRMTATNSEGKGVVYEYKKKLPKPIDPKDSVYKFDQQEIVKFRMKKVDPNISWAPFSKYLRSKEGAV